MQTPVTPIKAETAPAMLRHDFTAPQLSLVKVYMTRLAEADRISNECKQAIGLFMDFLQKENQMDENKTWSLAFDQDGTPFMAGAPIK